MKQTCRYTALIMAVILATLSLQSCAEDDEYYGNPLVGTWQMVAPLNGFYNQFTFYSNGTGTYYVEDDWGSDSYYINWYVYGNQLQVEFPDEMDTMSFLWQIDGYSLYLYPSDGSATWVYRLY
jgi:hypothetical protein